MIVIKKIGSDDILNAIKENDGYCICAVVKTAETKCMCKDFHDLQEGVCHCGLYEKTITKD